MKVYCSINKAKARIVAGIGDILTPEGVSQILGKCKNIFQNTGGVPSIFIIKLIKEIVMELLCGSNIV
jgi:hypothetical protein